MSHIIASNLCYAGTTNPKIREAIQDILAADFEGAIRILADAFIDTQEALEREQVAAHLTAQEDQEHITLLRGKLEEAQHEAQDLRHKLEEQKQVSEAHKGCAESAEERLEIAEEQLRESHALAAGMTARAEAAEEQLEIARDALEEEQARADHFEEIYEEYKGDALAARRMQERAQSFEARIKELEEELRESQALAASIDAERIKALKDLRYEEGCGEIRISYIQELHGEIQELHEQLEEVTKSRSAVSSASAFSMAPLRSAVWGGGVVPVYEDEDEDEDAVTPLAAAAPAAPKKPNAPSLIDLSNEDDDQPFYPPLSFNAAGCIEGCEICEGNKEMKDDIDRSELEDDMDMVSLFAATNDAPPTRYASGQLYYPEKPLSFEEIVAQS
jgi:hypothetical protein